MRQTIKHLFALERNVREARAALRLAELALRTHMKRKEKYMNKLKSRTTALLLAPLLVSCAVVNRNPTALTPITAQPLAAFLAAAEAEVPVVRTDTARSMAPVPEMLRRARSAGTTLVAYTNVVHRLELAETNHVRSVTLAWDEGDTATVGYRIYIGAASNSYTNSYLVGDTLTATIEGLKPGTTYYFAATGIDDQGAESNFSNEAVYGTPDYAPTFLNLRPPILEATAVPGRTNRIQTSMNLTAWLTITNFVPTGTLFRMVIDTTGPRRYYRGVVER